MSDDLHLPLFVYGTLMAGQPAHSLIASALERTRPARVAGLVMYSAGPYPLAVPGKGTIVGEIYWLRAAVYPDLLSELAAYEGPEYGRERYLAQPLATPAELVTVWVFVGRSAAAANLPLVPAGDWRQWQHQGQRPASRY